MSALSAAQAIWQDITLRSGIGNEAEEMPEALQREVIEVWAEIIAAETVEALTHVDAWWHSLVSDFHERVVDG